jgi:hypothetical protein
VGDDALTLPPVHRIPHVLKGRQRDLPYLDRVTKSFEV